MFTLRKDETFEWPVAFEYVDDGSHKEFKFKATFKIKGQSELAAAVSAIRSADNEKEIARLSGEVVRDVLVSFSGLPVEDANGNDISGTDAATDLVIDDPRIGPALYIAYNDGIMGRRRKN